MKIKKNHVYEEGASHDLILQRYLQQVTNMSACMMRVWQAQLVELACLSDFAGGYEKTMTSCEQLVMSCDFFMT